MKQCCRCKTNKPLDAFGNTKRNKDGKQRECKECQKLTNATYYLGNKQRFLNSNAKRRLENQERFAELKSTLTCSICPESRPWCLAFHHTDDNKEYDVSQLATSSFGWDTILAEISKCAVVCHNCHADIHYKLRATSSVG